MGTSRPIRRRNSGGSGAPPLTGTGTGLVLPVVFGDLRDLEIAERKKLDEERQRLEVIKRRRSLSKVQQALLDEIVDKLDNENVIVDPMFRAVQSGLALAGDSVPDHAAGRFPDDPPTAEEKQLAAVIGLLEADRAQPPAYHLPTSTNLPFDPSEEEREQRFGKALFAAQGEYLTNLDLFEAVLPILAEIGQQARGEGRWYEVEGVEWARVVRYLIEHNVTDPNREPQLGRKVDEALDSIQNVGQDLPPSDIEIDLPDIDKMKDNSMIPPNVRAMQPVYFAVMLEELKAFQVVDKLVELFQNGVLPIGRGEAGDALFKYWKETATRISEAERRNSYARMFGFPGGDDGGNPNRDFNELWLRFVSGVSEVVRQQTVESLLRSNIPASINQQQVRKAGRDLATNLSLHGFGMAHFMATELQKLIKDVLKLLSDPDIRNAYGARDPWQVIDQVATLELGGAKNSIRYRTMAASGAIIIAWLADHTEELSASFGTLLDMDEIRNPSPQPNGYKPTLHPSDFDLFNACDQWLAVTGTGDTQVEDYAQPKESPNMTSIPIQIPAIARDMLESVGVPAMGLGVNPGGNGRAYVRH